MKKVVLKPTEEVSIDSITDESIVGIEWINDGIKACVIKVDNLFCSVVPYQISDLYFVRNSKKDYVNALAAQCNTNVYVFDTEQDLINWLKL